MESTRCSRPCLEAPTVEQDSSVNKIVARANVGAPDGHGDKISHWLRERAAEANKSGAAAAPLLEPNFLPQRNLQTFLALAILQRMPYLWPGVEVKH